MTKLILDTNIIIRFPQILGLTIEDTDLIIPSSVLDEINFMGKQKNSLIDLINFSLLEGNIQVIDSSKLYNDYSDVIKDPRLSVVDKTLLAIALDLKGKNESVKIATQDKVIQEFALQYNIGFLNWDAVSDLLKRKKTEKAQTSIESKVSKFERKNRTNYITGILTGILTSVLALFIYKNLQLIFSTINIWGTIILILLVGIGLFIYREKQKLSYGIFEIAVGIIAIISLFTPVDFSYNQITFDLNFNLKLLGGLYIIVRGQDNVLKSIKNKKLGLWIKDKIGIG